MLHPKDPVDLRTGDQLVCETAIRRGDIVAFQRAGPNEVVWGAVPPQARAAWAGFLYRVDKGEDGHLRFEPVSTGPGGPPAADAERLVMQIQPPEEPPADDRPGDEGPGDGA